MIGYFGKVPSHGDFVSKGLPPALVEAWDRWLQQCMLESQRQLGDQWLAHYLTSPVWRFAISPGILGPEGLGGVMMPSVDRVGRYFPLMIGATGAPALLDWFQKQALWYAEIEELARASLHRKFTLAQFDGMPEPVIRSETLPPSTVTGLDRRLPVNADMGGQFAVMTLQWHSLWWTERAANIEASLSLREGLPRPSEYAQMLNTK